MSATQDTIAWLRRLAVVSCPEITCQQAAEVAEMLEGLQAENDEMTSEQCALRGELEVERDRVDNLLTDPPLARAWDALGESEARMRSEKRIALLERDAAIKERDLAIEKIIDTEKQRDEAFLYRATIERERDEARKERDAAIKERDEAKKRVDELFAEVTRLENEDMEELTQTLKERDALKAERNAILDAERCAITGAHYWETTEAPCLRCRAMHPHRQSEFERLKAEVETLKVKMTGLLVGASILEGATEPQRRKGDKCPRCGREGCTPTGPMGSCV